MDISSVLFFPFLYRRISSQFGNEIEKHSYKFYYVFLYFEYKLHFLSHYIGETCLFQSHFLFIDFLYNDDCKIIILPKIRTRFGFFSKKTAQLPSMRHAVSDILLLYIPIYTVAAFIDLLYPVTL